MTDLDLLWRRHAPAEVLALRPDFRTDPRRPGAQTFYRELQAQAPAIDEVLARLTTDPALSAAIAEGQPDAGHLVCELIRTGEPADLAVSDFSMRAYLDWHPDIARTGMDPLRHYLLYGAREGRRTLATLREARHPGRRPYNPDLPTCLIAVHELSRTGAPIVGLDLAREAAETHNVILATLRDGPLLDSFLDHVCDLVVTSQPLDELPYCTGEIFQRIGFAILNSVECFAFVPFLVSREIPFASYVHEYADYTFPAYKSTFTALFADLLIFSSDHVRDSWTGRLKDIEFDIGRDTMVLPQRGFAVGGVDAARIAEARGRISALIGRDCSQVRLVCGAGHLQWRKGSDIFAMTAQICRPRDPDTVFLWIGDGLNPEDMGFGVWMDYHLRQVGAGQPEGNLFLLPAGPAYPDVLAASDAMFVSSRLDPLPNVVFDALDAGCRIVLFDGASGFGDAVYRRSDHILPVEYANPEAAATALLGLPRKTGLDRPAPPAPQERLFAGIRAGLEARLRAQRYFVRGASRIDVPMLFPREDHAAFRVREREKMLRYGRRLVWRDIGTAEAALEASDNWVHRRLRLAPYATTTDVAAVPPFSIHVHAFYTDDLAEDIRAHFTYRLARRIVVTTDSERKACEIRALMAAEGLVPEVAIVPNRGRDILPFMELFLPGGLAGEDEIWCHLHQKKSFATTDSGDVWRQFLLRILLGDEAGISDAVLRIAETGTGLVAPFDPYHIPWNASRALLPKVEPRLPGPLPDNPLLFPVGNMFWVRRQVVEAMNALFGPGYPWPNEPIANDGTEFHLVERLWPAITTASGLDSVFVHKLDQKRV
ncbi:rhamnan synthesis F family protein [Rhodobacter sp. CZR27]|uniref:rhamnan synthesis F family protein n=1 Tax=Rhodobacter sp. CZR27 TaxID=2033869 RepID=UPI000BBE227A|nr:rhamnan synthesis F family protein [Rhodobacter sp. CZR27]